MRGKERQSWSRAQVLVAALAVCLAILACGISEEMLLPPEQPSGSGGSAPMPAQPGEPLETLAPLPNIGVEEVATPEDTGSVDVGDVRWTLLQAAELGESLASDSDDVDDLTATGRLIGVRFQVENLGPEPLTFLGMQVVDDQGRRQAYLSQGLPFIIDEEACQMEDLEPGASITCTALYDVAADATGLQAELTDLSLLGGETILVDLGLD